MRKNLKKSILGLGISISLLALVLGYSIGDRMNSAFNISSHPRDAAPNPTIAIDGEVELSQFISDENLDGDGSFETPLFKT
ncbi:MAG: hypothetical protein ACTSVZ_02610 [Promethearchaeota archaeon]